MIPKVYDPQTKHAFHGAGTKGCYQWKLPDLLNKRGYLKAEMVTNAYAPGAPESRGYESVYMCSHPAAKAWVENMRQDEISRLRTRLKELEGENGTSA
tara:strand:- start:38 stop:331 length:294 start_codon:yes stop_codon:yes gene_type:complete